MRVGRSRSIEGGCGTNVPFKLITRRSILKSLFPLGHFLVVTTWRVDTLNCKELAREASQKVTQILPHTGQSNYQLALLALNCVALGICCLKPDDWWLASSPPSTPPGDIYQNKLAKKNTVHCASTLAVTYLEVVTTFCMRRLYLFFAFPRSPTGAVFYAT